MAETAKKATDEPVIQETQEPEYTAKELAEAAETMFHTKPECVIAAFHVAGIEKATVAKAQDIITKFLTKEVK